MLAVLFTMRLAKLAQRRKQLAAAKEEAERAAAEVSAGPHQATLKDKLAEIAQLQETVQVARASERELRLLMGSQTVALSHTREIMDSTPPSDTVKRNAAEKGVQRAQASVTEAQEDVRILSTKVRSREQRLARLQAEVKAPPAMQRSQATNQASSSHSAGFDPVNDSGDQARSPANRQKAPLERGGNTPQEPPILRTLPSVAQRGTAAGEALGEGSGGDDSLLTLLSELLCVPRVKGEMSQIKRQMHIQDQRILAVTEAVQQQEHAQSALLGEFRLLSQQLTVLQGQLAHHASARSAAEGALRRQGMDDALLRALRR